MATSSDPSFDPFASSGIKAIEPEPTNDGSTDNDPSKIDITIPSIGSKEPNFDAFPTAGDEPTQDPDPTTDPEPQTGDEPAGDDNDDAVNYFERFRTELGLEGEFKGESFDDFIDMAKQAISPYKEKVEFFESNITPALVDHIKAGGTIDSFLQYPQETNFYQDIQFEEDDVERREELVYDYYERQGIEKEEAELLVNNMKEKGKFNTFSDSVLDRFKEYEKGENAKIAQQRKADEEAAIKHRDELVTGVKESFEKGLPGVTVDKDIFEEAKRISLPNSKGQFDINDIKLTPAQESIINTLIVAITKGKSFQYAPTKATATNTSKVKPINQIFGRDSSSGKGKREEVGTLDELNSIFSKAK